MYITLMKKENDFIFVKEVEIPEITKNYALEIIKNITDCYEEYNLYTLGLWLEDSPYKGLPQGIYNYDVSFDSVTNLYNKINDILHIKVME